MLVLDIYKLVNNGKVNKIFLGGEIANTFHQLDTELKKLGYEPSASDMFVAGYMLANPNLRDKYKIFRDKKYDSIGKEIH